MKLQEKQLFLLISISLVIATLIAYEPVRYNDFVKYDDDKYITENSDVMRGITLDSLTWAFAEPHLSNWHPMTLLSHMLDCQLFGLNPVGHHFVNVLFHILNAILVFGILTNLTGSIWASAFTAAVFALHPMQVESVAWAAERKNVLSGLFWLLTMAAYIRYTKRPGVRRYLMVILIYGLSITTKPVVVTLPLALILLDYWPLERLRLGHAAAGKAVPIRWLLIEKIPMLAMSIVLSIVTVFAQQSGGAVMKLEEIPFDSRAANMFVSYISYIGKMIWPDKLAVFYPHISENLQMNKAAACTLLFFLISVLSIYLGRRRRFIATGWFWYIVTFVPMIGLIQVGAQAMANRYMYLPILGLLFIIGWAAKDLIAGNRGHKVIAAASTAVVLCCLLMLTRGQVRHWKNTLTLLGYAQKCTRPNIVTEAGYGSALLEAGRLEEAEVHLRKALRMKPENPVANFALGRIFLQQGKFSEAIACFNVVSEDSVNPTEWHTSLGAVYVQFGRYDLAVQHLTRAFELEPTHTGALNNMAWLLATTDGVSAEDANKAVEFAQRACELTGNKDPAFLDTLAVAYAASGRFGDAVKTANEALNLAESVGQKSLVSEIRNRLKLYQSGKRYQQEKKRDDR
ncbi:MAG: tetratricopeptide repeat protein [Sedimentisphaerales bacterium]|nr:tetratricopeptide repeat protein [Sedimentisphaerales bacterium]